MARQAWYIIPLSNIGGITMRYLILALLLVSCATQPMGGLTRPGLTTNPKTYLQTVGLDRYTKQDVVNIIGPPHRQATVDGLEYWTYQLSESGARARYTYIFDDAVLVDVRYNQDLGSYGYDGLTAKGIQSKQ